MHSLAGRVAPSPPPRVHRSPWCPLVYIKGGPDRIKEGEIWRLENLPVELLVDGA